MFEELFIFTSYSLKIPFFETELVKSIWARENKDSATQLIGKRLLTGCLSSYKRVADLKKNKNIRKQI